MKKHQYKKIFFFVKSQISSLSFYFERTHIKFSSINLCLILRKGVFESIHLQEMYKNTVSKLAACNLLLYK